MNGPVAHWNHVAVALLGIVLGAAAISQTGDMSELGRVFPVTASVIAIAAGSGLLIQVFLRRHADTRLPEETDFARAGLLSATLLIWALVLKPVGFILSSAVAIVAIAVIARREPMTFRSIVLHAVAGAALVLGFAFLLSEVLNVRLP